MHVDILKRLRLTSDRCGFDTRVTNEASVGTGQSLGRPPTCGARFGSVRPAPGKPVLEVNAGPGHTTCHLLDRDQFITLDSDPVHVKTLRRRFGHLENLDVVLNDCSSSDCDLERMNTALLFDGLQRASEPKQFLTNVAACLESGGKILIQVPAGTDLYGPPDDAAGIVRRFEQADAEEMVRAAGLELVQIESFNRLGAFGWRLHHTLGAGGITAAEARRSDLHMHPAKRIDSAGIGVGLSWLVVARVA